jgi:hypothetical protein
MLAVQDHAYPIISTEILYAKDDGLDKTILNLHSTLKEELGCFCCSKLRLIVPETITFAEEPIECRGTTLHMSETTFLLAGRSGFGLS